MLHNADITTGLKQRAAMLHGKGHPTSDITQTSGILQYRGPHSTITAAHSAQDTMHSSITGRRRNTGDDAVEFVCLALVA